MYHFLQKLAVLFYCVRTHRPTGPLFINKHMTLSEMRLWCMPELWIAYFFWLRLCCHSKQYHYTALLHLIKCIRKLETAKLQTCPLFSPQKSNSNRQGYQISSSERHLDLSSHFAYQNTYIKLSYWKHCLPLVQCSSCRSHTDAQNNRKQPPAVSKKRLNHHEVYFHFFQPSYGSICK